jgi:hypothetical protein
VLRVEVRWRQLSCRSSRFGCLSVRRYSAGRLCCSYLNVGQLESEEVLSSQLVSDISGGVVECGH